MTDIRRFDSIISMLKRSPNPAFPMFDVSERFKSFHNQTSTPGPGDLESPAWALARVFRQALKLAQEFTGLSMPSLTMHAVL